MTGREERSGTDEIPAEVLRRAVYTSPRASGSCPASPESEEGCMGKRSSGTSEERGKKLAFLEIGEILRSAFSRITTATAKPLKKDGSRAVAGALESVSKLFLNVPVWYIYGNWFRSFEEIREPLLKHFFEQHAAAEANDVALYYISNGCRSVALGADVLVRVLLTGIDVPRNNCFYSSDIVKAAEYGGFPKLVLLLDMKKFDRIFFLLEYIVGGALLIVIILITYLYSNIFVYEEMPEIAILKSMGFRNGGVRKWYILRMLILTLISLVCAEIMAWSCGTPMYRAFMKQYHVTGVKLELELPVSFVVIPLIVASAILLTAYFTAIKVKNIDIWNISEE